MTDVQLPYFDFLLSQLEKHNEAIEKSFGRHVHWGYWPDPANASLGDDDYGRAAERLTLELCDLAQLESGQDVLDVGCGFGGTIASINERFDNMRLTGLNIDARQLERARGLVHPLRGNTVEFVEGDACALPFPDASFDRVLAVECIFHFPSREKFFREARRVLRPGGRIVLSDFVPSAVYLPACKLGQTKFFQKFNAFGGCAVDTTIARYHALAASTGLVVETERDITANTLPTWLYVRTIVARQGVSDWVDRVFSVALGFHRWLGKVHMLNYYLLAFRKP